MKERLQKLISGAGLASRRAAEEMIKAGRVKVNGETAVLGMSADPDTDTVTVDGKRLRQPEARVYIMLNKPRGYVTTLSDEKGRKTKARAEFYRAALTGGDVKKAYEGLDGIPADTADLGNGSNLLPKNVSTTLLTEPIQENPLRPICRVTNITGYEEPKLGFTIEDADIGDVTDKQTANEIAMEGDTVT